MDADINSKEGSYTAETIRYDDSQIQTILSELASVKTLLDEVSSEISNIENHEHYWEGESKKQYLELKGFMKKYQKDYKDSVDQLYSTISNLETLLGSISSSNVIKEIDNA